MGRFLDGKIKARSTLVFDGRSHYKAIVIIEFSFGLHFATET